MSRTSRWSLRTSALALGLVCTSLFSLVAQAASINYGDFGPVAPGVSFLQVTESSDDPLPPLYGPPASVFPTGMLFQPQAFTAVAINGAPGDVDSVDGQLNFAITSGLGVTNIDLSEDGDYSLDGTGTNATTVGAGVIMRAIVTEVNGAVVAPIAFGPVNASVSFDLVANGGLAQPWSLGLGLPINLPAGQRATKVLVNIDNVLTANSEPLTSARIAKKDFRIDIDTVIPEPATMVLAGMGLCGMAVVARRKRS